MSLLLDSLERVKTKQRVWYAPPQHSTTPGSQDVISPGPLVDVALASPVIPDIAFNPAFICEPLSEAAFERQVEQATDASAAMATPGIVVNPANTGAVMSDDTCARELRRVVTNILAAYPNTATLGLAFVTLDWTSEEQRFMPALTRQFVQCTAAEVLLVDDAGTFDAERPWQSWKQRFRYVIVQSECGANDMKLLTGADGVYLAVALGKTLRRSVKDAIARLQLAGAPIRGCVLIG